MSKKVRNLMIGVGGVAVLAIVLVVLLNLPEPSTSSEQSSFVSTSVVLVDHKEEDVQTVTVNNEKGEYTAKKTAENTLMVEEIADLPLDTNYFKYLLTDCAKITASQLVEENPSDLTKYGLSSPRATATVTYSGGEVVTVKIGNEAPTTSNTYVQVSGDQNVYVISSSSTLRFLYGVTDYMTKELTQAFDPEAGQAVTFESMALGGSLREQAIDIRLAEQDPDKIDTSQYFSSFTLTMGDKKAEGDSTKIDKLIKSVFNISSAEIAAYNTKPEDLEKYGLKDPYSTIDFKSEEYSVKLASSEPKDGFVYMTNGTPIIYKVETADILWITTQFNDVRSRLMLMPFIENVNRLTVTTPEGDYVFDASGKEDDFAATCNGKPIDIANYKSFYQVVLSATADEATDLSIEGLTPIVTYTYEYEKQGKKPDVIRFYPGPTRKVLVALNDDMPFLTSETYLDELRADAVKVSNNQEVKP